MREWRHCEMWEVELLEKEESMSLMLKDWWELLGQMGGIRVKLPLQCLHSQFVIIWATKQPKHLDLVECIKPTRIFLRPSFSYNPSLWTDLRENLYSTLYNIYSSSSCPNLHINKSWILFFNKFDTRHFLSCTHSSLFNLLLVTPIKWD